MTEAASQRIDKWLHFARVVKSRSLAAKLATSGRVRINAAKTEHAAAMVKVGDVLTMTLERRVLVYRVAAIGARRGPPPEAQRLYEDLSPAQGSSDAGEAELPDELPSFRSRPQ